MKPRQIRRDISSRHSRDLGNAPNLGRISKLRGSDRVQAGRVRQVESPFRRYRTVGFAVLSAVVALTVIVAGAWTGLRLRSRFVPTELQASQSRMTEDQVRIVSKVKSPTEEQALDLVLDALKSPDVKTVEEKFRLSDTPAAEAVRFLLETKAAALESSNLRWLGSADIEGQLMECVFINGADGDSKSGRNVFLVPDEKGKWKVDFEAYARTSKPDWKELLDERAETAKVRVYVAADSYYNGPFAEESAWNCYGMTSPEASKLLPEEQRLMYGYCRKDSPQARALRRVVSPENPIMRVTLEIKRTKVEDKLQFEITRVFSEDWVVPDKPFDERFL